MNRNTYLTIAAAIVFGIAGSAYSQTNSTQQNSSQMPNHSMRQKLTQKEVKALIVNAKTPEDHQKLAAFYREEARDQESKAKYHDEMAALYKTNPIPTRDMAKHCKYFAEEARKSAESATKLAEEHEAMAAQLRNGK